MFFSDNTTFIFRFSLSSLTSLVKDLVRLLQVVHGSIHEAFSSSDNHSQLDCFFALLHRTCMSQTEDGTSITDKPCNIGQVATILSLPNEIKVGSNGFDVT